MVPRRARRYVFTARPDLPRRSAKLAFYYSPIPIVADFEKVLKIPSVMMGFGLPDDNLHAPNEKFHIPNFYRGIETICRFFEKLGG